MKMMLGGRPTIDEGGVEGGATLPEGASEQVRAATNRAKHVTRGAIRDAFRRNRVRSIPTSPQMPVLLGEARPRVLSCLLWDHQCQGGESPKTTVGECGLL